MTKTKWWLRVVGVFYLLLTAMNLYGLFINTSFFNSMLPYAATDTAVKAFADAWLVFVAELGVLGAMMLYASRNPERSSVLVWTIVWAEVFRGIVADAIWISRGYSAASYIGFIVVHVIIVATGVYFIRQESAKAAA